MTRNEETMLVKQALKIAGFDGNNNVRVKHGTGTAWGWLKVYATIHRRPRCSCIIRKDTPTETCEECKSLWQNCYKRLNDIAIKASGRTGYAAESIGVHLGFAE